LVFVRLWKYLAIYVLGPVNISPITSRSTG
jgi:hypothetical protein